MKLHEIRCHSNEYLTAEHAKIAEIFLIFFLGVLCELCGELLVSFSIRPAIFLPVAGLTPESKFAEPNVVKS
jgi:hypothetical protein